MKVHIITLGCKLNQFESQAIANNLLENGFVIAESVENADTVIVNTCTVTNKADSKSRRAMRSAKMMGKFVVAAGCYAETDFDALESFDYIDMVIANENKFSIAGFLAGATEESGAVDAVDDYGYGTDEDDNGGGGFESNSGSISKKGRQSDFPIVSSFERTRAFLKIQDGCDKYCSYCKIPAARGRSRSFSPDKILELIQSLVNSGYKEIVLTGVNISDYHFEGIKGYNLHSLVGDILNIPGDFRIRLSSLQPDEFDHRLIGFLSYPKFANHLHLSLQSGSDDVLKRMNRHYTAAYFVELTEKIRTASPDCGITTDIIVGFPGETDDEFRQTLETVKASRLTRAHIFPYSPRDHTKAALMKDMSGTIKKQREIILKEASIRVCEDFINKSILRSPQKVLIETKDKDGYSGYTSNYFRFTSADPSLKINEFFTLSAGKYIIKDDGSLELTSVIV